MGVSDVRAYSQVGGRGPRNTWAPCPVVSLTEETLRGGGNLIIVVRSREWAKKVKSQFFVATEIRSICFGPYRLPNPVLGRVSWGYG